MHLQRTTPDPAEASAVVYAWLAENLYGVRRFDGQTEIYYKLGIHGDDFDELVGWLQDRFAVDLRS